MSCLRLAVIAAVAFLATGVAAQAQVYEVGTDGTLDRLDVGRPVLPAPVALARRQGRSKVDRAATYRPIVTSAAAQYAVSPALVDAIARSESNYDQRAVSRARAVGIMQLMPGTARQLGVDSANPEANIRGGTAYLRFLLNRYDGDIICAISAYNAGPGAVSKSHCVPAYRETATYVARVLDHLAKAAN